MPNPVYGSMSASQTPAPLPSSSTPRRNPRLVSVVAQDTPARHSIASGVSRASRVSRASKASRRSQADVGRATITSSVTNLTNTLIGAGALAFPSAFAAMGLIPGIISCLFSGSMTLFGLYLLSRCATVVGTRPGDEGRKASFNEVARLTFGAGWATKLFDLAIAIKCFGVSVSYLIICKTLLPQVCQALAAATNHHLADHSILRSQDFWLVISMAIIVPLSFLKTLDALRFTSQIALSTVVYLLCIVIGFFILKGPSPNRGEVKLARFGTNTLSSFPVQIFAYTCAQNIFAIHNELKDRTQQRMNTVIGSSIGIAALCYETLAIIGYLTFGSNVGSNIIAMYPPTSLVIALGRLGIVLLVGLSYPLQCLPARSCIHLLTKGWFGKEEDSDDEEDEEVSDYEDEAEEGEGEEAEDEPNEDGQGNGAAAPLLDKHGEDEHGAPLEEMPWWKYIGITIFILVAGFLIALSVDELEVVLGFVGSTGSTILSFILPGFFYFRLWRKEPGVTKWFALALGIYGFCVMAFCLSFNIYHTIRGDRNVGH